ncbi:MAG: hypothetical protein ACOYOZ_11950, partial [Pirellula sp.]
MTLPKIRETLSLDGLIRIVSKGFHRVCDHRQRPQIPLGDVLGAAFAMFSLKDPSLLAFDQRRPDANLRQLYCLGHVPSDTSMRERVQSHCAASFPGLRGEATVERPLGILVFSSVLPGWPA